MSRTTNDSPYRDSPSHAARPQRTDRSTSSAPRERSARPPRERSQPARATSRDSRKSPPAESSAPRRRSRRGRKKSPYAGQEQLTSQPTGRGAYAETRSWLLAEHGPVCAYCGDRFPAAKMTLDHVAPRRGQTAYDRRDNLVLACQPCNAAKKDLPPIAFLLARRTRAAHLLRYGSHLSPMLLEMARSLAPTETIEVGSDGGSGGYADDSPYRD